MCYAVFVVLCCFTNRWYGVLSVQIATLDEASLQHRKESWWIKADGCDLVSSLEESVRLEWNGDVDFGDGKLQQLFKSYHQRLCGLEDLSKLSSNPQLVLMALKLEGNFIINDLKLLTDGMQTLVIY